MGKRLKHQTTTSDGSGLHCLLRRTTYVRVTRECRPELSGSSHRLSEVIEFLLARLMHVFFFFFLLRRHIIYWYISHQKFNDTKLNPKAACDPAAPRLRVIKDRVSAAMSKTEY